MKTTTINITEDRIEQWYNQIRDVDSMTEYDACLLKELLLDTIDELKGSGLNDEEAFEVAVIRLGKDFKKEYTRVNSDTLLIRNVLFVFSGIMIYFLLYYSMIICCRLMYYNLHEVIDDPEQLLRYTRNFLISFHVFIALTMIVIFNWGKIFLKKIKNLNIRPLYVFLLTALIFGLAFTDFELQYLVKVEVPRKYLVDARYLFILRDAGYSFPLVVSICFISLLIKNKLSSKKLFKWRNSGEEGYNNQLQIEELIKTKFNNPFQELITEGWNEEEAIAIIKVRYKTSPQYNIKLNNTDAGDKPVKFNLIVLSGGFVYLFFYYLLHSTSRIYLTVLQTIENDPVKNFGWIKWFIASYNLLLIFFTTSIYIKDKNLLPKLKKLNTRRFLVICLGTIIFAVLDYVFLPISRLSLKNVPALKIKFNDIIQFSDLIFSLVISVCFLILFNKYYRENMKTI